MEDICYRPNASEDTIVHEMVHHLRTMDTERKGYSRAAAVDTDGYATRKRTKRESIEEEARTVAESAVRTRKPADRPSGYYRWAGERDLGFVERRAAYEHDRNVLLRRGSGASSKSEPLKGTAAVNAIEKNYWKTAISKLRKTNN